MPESNQHSVFTDPVTQALHERNLEWLQLMKEDPGWALSRLHRCVELEEQLEALRIALTECLFLAENNNELSEIQRLRGIHRTAREALASNPATRPE